MLLLPICAGGSRLKYLDVSCVLGCVSGMFNMFNMSGMVMDSIGAGVAPVASPPHCVPVFWAVQCLVSGQGRISASLSGGQPIISLCWPPCTNAMCGRPYIYSSRPPNFRVAHQPAFLNSQVTLLQPYLPDYCHFLPISSLSWPYDLGFWLPGNKRAADCPDPPGATPMCLADAGCRRNRVVHGHSPTDRITDDYLTKWCSADMPPIVTYFT